MLLATSATIDCDGWILASLSRSERSALIICSFRDLKTTSGFNGSSTLERFERSNASEIRNGIMFDFYPGLPHMRIKLEV